MTASRMMTMWNRCGGGESDDLDVRVPPQVSHFAAETRPSRGSAGRSCRRSSMPGGAEEFLVD
eukprot:15797997-Heterocapsa_arctica.AAC.1